MYTQIGEIWLLLFAFQEGTSLTYLTESRSGCGTSSCGESCTPCFLSLPFSSPFASSIFTSFSWSWPHHEVSDRARSEPLFVKAHIFISIFQVGDGFPWDHVTLYLQPRHLLQWLPTNFMLLVHLGIVLLLITWVIFCKHQFTYKCIS